jgi:hypothetical protein
VLHRDIKVSRIGDLERFFLIDLLHRAKTSS